MAEQGSATQTRRGRPRSGNTPSNGRRSSGRRRSTASSARSNNSSSADKMYHVLELVGRKQAEEEGANLFMKSGSKGGDVLVDRGVFPGSGPKAQERAVDAYLDENPGQEEFNGYAVPERMFNRQHVALEPQAPKRVRS